ncbi:MAG: hypothetical protein M3O33_16330 [Cyanobacteriota bacterium]|nr:hypothetical protein [Cyanobacteriota bacterium]
MKLIEDNSQKTEPLTQKSKAKQSQPDNFNISEPLANTSKKSKWSKKKLSAIAEFTILTWLGWLDPTLGFWISVMVLVWHLITDKE